MTKILFTDLDGTLLDDKKQIPEDNKKAVERMISQGHKIVLTSGRALKNVIDQAEKLGLDFEGCYLIAFNGGVIYDNYRKKTLYKNVIPLDIVSEIFDFSEEKGVHIQTYDEDHVLSRHKNKHIDRYCREIGCEVRLIDDVQKDLEEEPSKMLLLDYDNHELLEGMRDQILEKRGDMLDAFFSSPGLLEVVPKGIDKGVAVRKLCSILEIPIENSVAAGDGMNDRPMLCAAHIGAAMSNAEEPIKKVADYISKKDNNHGGIAEIINKYF